MSVAKRCKNLVSLDVSWCRNLTDEALGLIADSCLSLEVLKVFGCTQVCFSPTMSWSLLRNYDDTAYLSFYIRVFCADYKSVLGWPLESTS